MAEHILVTGGAGFIGSHLTDQLLAQGHRVRVLDSLVEQVHGAARRRPPHISPEVELLVGDVRDPAALRSALEGVDVVYHFAALVGVGQSMYRVADYASVNSGGTALLLDALARRALRRLIFASSMSLYGEGLYRRADGTAVHNVHRTPAQLRRGRWEPELDGEMLEPLPTPEEKTPTPGSVYATTKYAAEQACLLVGRAYSIPTVTLRFFNVYGPRQSLSNPYAGVIANFAARLLNGARPLVYEDGLQRRDFVHVRDAVRAAVLALGSEPAVGHAINIGCGRSASVLEVAQVVARTVGKGQLEPERSEKHRAGDIRHCFADAQLAKRLLGFEPSVSLEQGVRELAVWLRGQTAVDRAWEARAELDARGLT
jgi:dTDP-L-rhamnose 4-epimerase